MTYPFGKSVVLVTRTRSGKDADGNAVWAETPTTFTNVPVWPGGEGSGLTGSEQLQGQDTVATGLSMLLPAGTVVLPTDAVTLDGQRWEVSGTPFGYDSPLTGTRPGVLVRLKRVTG